MRNYLRQCLYVAAVLAAIPAFAKDAPGRAKEGNMINEPSTSTLSERALVPLPLGAIRPAGWLANQLRIQADGLSGHLDEFWSDIKNSGWIGGPAEGWERVPYWLDGVIPLAYTLDDAALKEKVTRWMDYILEHQAEDGWLGPVDSKGYKPLDPWPRFVMLKAMTQYAEASGDARVVPVMQKFLHKLDALLDTQPLFDWGKFRWMDLLVPVQWLYDRTGEAWLLELAAKAHAQGFDWRGHYAEFKHTDRVPADQCRFETHVVNNAMAVKAAGVWFRQSKDPGDRDAVYQALKMLDQYHGQVTGIFSGDEHYAGRSPSQGSECCSVVEYMFSLETLLSILGDPAFGDRLERIAYNALPGTFTGDMWAHQYDQLANQAVCRRSDDKVYATNGPDANLFGLEPNYGCCTANFSQGWPKLVSHLWMKTPDGGLAAVAYAPCEVKTDLPSGPVRVKVDTDYPFTDEIRIAVTGQGRFPLRLRIPAWAEGAEVRVGDAKANTPQAGSFYVLDRDWNGEASVVVRLPMKPRIERRFHNSASILRGPLVFSLKIGEYWKQVGGEAPRADWEVYPTTPWNYGIRIDETAPAKCVAFETKPVGACPFSPDGAPVTATITGRMVPEWIIEHSAAGLLPASPVKSAQPEMDLKLIPYGSAKLRISEFPVLE